MTNFFIISGCSGGGKSSLLTELSAKGFHSFEEPGRRVIRQQVATNGRALPWIDLRAFLFEAIALAYRDYETATSHPGIVFFDRGLIDAASALREMDDHGWFERLRNSFRYRRKVFLTPPWPDLYSVDAERRHGLEEAIQEYERLLRDYRELEYDTVLLPKVSVLERARFILRELQIC